MKTVPFLAVSVFIIPHSVQKSNGILKFFQSAVVFVAFAQEMKKFHPDDEGYFEFIPTDDENKAKIIQFVQAVEVISAMRQNRSLW